MVVVMSEGCAMRRADLLGVGRKVTRAGARASKGGRGGAVKPESEKK